MVTACRCCGKPVRQNPAENRKGSVQIFAEINGGIAILIWLNEKQIMRLSAWGVRNLLLFMAMQTESTVAISVM